MFLLQEWLAGCLPNEPVAVVRKRVKLLPHCSERSIAQGSLSDWQKVFRHFGIELDVVPAGCCGMAGAYGHDRKHEATSKRIFELSWAQHTSGARDSISVVATGYSCRRQAARFAGVRLRHPLQYLLCDVYHRRHRAQTGSVKHIFASVE